MKSFALSFLLIGICSIPTNAQYPPEIISKFFDVYKSKGADPALDYIFSTNPFANDIASAVDQLKAKLRALTIVDGSFSGYDILTVKSAGDNYKMYTILVRHERDPITFRILFYHPSDKWQLQNFKFDNKMDDELNEASKAMKFKDN